MNLNLFCVLVSGLNMLRTVSHVFSDIMTSHLPVPLPSCSSACRSEQLEGCLVFVYIRGGNLAHEFWGF